MDELSRSELWRCVETTVRGVLLPAIADDEDWARAVAVQLIGLAQYAGSRPERPAHERVDELADVLAGISANPIVAARWSGARTAVAVAAAAGGALADAVGRDDAAADEIRSVLRPVLVRQLADELAVTGPLVGAFRGRLDA